MRKSLLAIAMVALVGWLPVATIPEAEAGTMVACYEYHRYHCPRPKYRKKVVRRPAPVPVPAVYAPSVRAPDCPQGLRCAIDLDVVFIECVQRDGKLIWRYRASNGKTYSMMVQQRNPRDKLRLHPDRRIEWAIAR